MTLNEFYSLFEKEVPHFEFRLDVSFSECAPGHHPLLRAETYITEKGEHIVYEDDFCPLSAVVRRHLPRLKEESLIDHSLQEWGEELGVVQGGHHRPHPRSGWGSQYSEASGDPASFGSNRRDQRPRLNPPLRAQGRALQETCDDHRRIHE